MTARAKPISVDNLVTILDQLEYNVLITDRDGTIEYVNTAFERTSGYRSDEVLGRTPRVLNSGVHGREVYDELWQTLLSGKSFRFIFTNRKKGGELYEEAVWISVIRDSGGEISHFVSLGRVTGESRRTYDLFTLLADSSPAGVYIVQDERFIFANAEFQRYSGYRAKEIVGKEWLHLVSPEDREAVRQSARAMLAGETSTPYEYRLVDKAGDERWVLEKVVSVDFVGLRTEQAGYVAGTIVDITDRKRAEDQLKEALSVYGATVESTTDGIIVVDLSGTVRQLNNRFLEMWGLPRVRVFSGASVQAAVGLMLPQIEEPDVYAARVQQTLARPEGETTDVVELKDGRVFEVYSKPQVIEGVATGRVWSFRDVTERRRFEAALMRLANYDSLTGLLNRRRFQEEMEQAVADLGESVGSGALIVMDVDRFKDVNDHFGHQAGDEVLAQLGGVLRSVFADHMVARFGGEEFAVFLRDADAREAQAAAQKLAKTLRRRRLSAGGTSLRITVSMGIAAFPAHGETVSELFSHADLALYDAKFGGRNRTSLYSVQTNILARQFRESWRHRFQEAVENRRLLLLAQPIVHAAEGSLAGYELLVRIRNPDGTLLAAKDFVPIAEQLGLIPKIDEWVIVEAAKLLREVQDRGGTFRLGMNLGGWAFSDDKMLDFLRTALRESGADPTGLVIEMTETAALSDVTKARRFVENLRALGCHFALDDFGVGYASFDYLKRLPVEILKIDGSFIRDLTRSAVSREIVAAIVSAAKGLGISTVAESVHNADTFRVVRQMGVDRVQGYWVGRPRKATNLVAGLVLKKAA